MKRRAERIDALARLAELVRDADRQKLAAVLARDREIARRVAEAETARRERLLSLAEGPDTARMAGQDTRWDAWIESRIAGLNMERARLRARAEDIRAALSRSEGRAQVARRLSGRAGGAG